MIRIIDVIVQVISHFCIEFVISKLYVVDSTSFRLVTARLFTNIVLILNDAGVIVGILLVKRLLRISVTENARLLLFKFGLGITLYL